MHLVFCVVSQMKTEFTDEDRRLATDQTDLRYWPHDTHAHNVRKLIPQLGYLARGYDEPATLDGPIGTNMVTLPGVLTPMQWDPKRWVVGFLFCFCFLVGCLLGNMVFVLSPFVRRSRT